VIVQNEPGRRCTWECAANIHHLTKKVEELTQVVESLAKKSLVGDARLEHDEQHSAAKSQAVVRIMGQTPQAQPTPDTGKNFSKRELRTQSPGIREKMPILQEG
ncbi:hypothetical protein THOM_0717, partial [Trachipleistophora hominis]